MKLIKCVDHYITEDERFIVRKRCLGGNTSVGTRTSYQYGYEVHDTITHNEYKANTLKEIKAILTNVYDTMKE